METIKVQIDEKKAQEVRRVAMELYGHKKGSISNAINAALDEWLIRLKTRKKQKNAPSWNRFIGSLKGEKMSAVEMQHHIAKELWPNTVD